MPGSTAVSAVVWLKYVYALYFIPTIPVPKVGCFRTSYKGTYRVSTTSTSTSIGFIFSGGYLLFFEKALFSYFAILFFIEPRTFFR